MEIRPSVRVAMFQLLVVASPGPYTVSCFFYFFILFFFFLLFFVVVNIEPIGSKNSTRYYCFYKSHPNVARFLTSPEFNFEN